MQIVSPDQLPGRSDADVRVYSCPACHHERRFGLPTQRLKCRVGWRPHLIFSNCQTPVAPKREGFFLVAKITKLLEPGEPALQTTSVEKVPSISDKFAKTRAEAFSPLVIACSHKG
jgi:hypothetical protein